MTQQQGKTAGVAVASLVLGILGLTLIWAVGSIPAVICGHIAWSKVRQSNGALKGEGMALAGLITGCIGIVVTVLVVIFALSYMKAREAALTNANSSYVTILHSSKG